MPAIGITGGIATGKSTFCDCLREVLPGAKFFNADQSAREFSQTDAEVKKEITEEFGPGVYSPAGDLNREQLRATILQSPGKKEALERILHPRIRRRWGAEAQAHRNSGEYFFADIPLLYETDGQNLCDRVVVVACSPDVQLARLNQRGSLPGSQAGEMISAQMPLLEKIRLADHVVWNNGERSGLMEQARLLVGLWTKSWTKKLKHPARK